MALKEQLVFKLKNFPSEPGCYMWKNKDGQIIYIGKAKNLFNRVHQYFQNNVSDKTKALVENIDDVDFVITKNENESLILEANLIKQYQPKYNILLKENNNYPYIVLTNEEHPRFIYTRNIKFFKGKVYGPFAYGNFDKYEIYILLNQIFPLRKCYKLPHRKCLYYDIKECVGPCINTIQPEYYVEIAKKVDDFFHGKNKELIDKLKAKEKASAEQLNFESAGKYASLITSIKNITTSIKSDVMLKNKNQLDFVGFYIKESHIAIVIYSYINGKLLAMNQEINTIYDDTNERITDYIYQYYIAAHSASSTVYMELPETDIDLLNNSIEKSFISPKSGKYKSILKTACVNAQKYYESNYLIYESKSRETDDAMDNLKKLIKIEQLNLIHVYDMSNLFEENKIGAMIVVENGKFNKKLYRKFNIKNSESHGDTEYMYECVLREYKKVIEENSGFPDLIIVDGGINQINAAINALQTLELDKIIRVIGLSKNNKHKTSQIVTKEETFSLDIRSPLYKWLFNIQEEVHRFAISFFRNKKSKQFFEDSVLNNIPGLGKKSVEKLLKVYGNVGEIKKATVEELSKYVKKEIAQKILDS